ncbi:MAG: ankyrin repeat domain-containing protein [Planctomycetota bacterium]
MTDKKDNDLITIYCGECGAKMQVSADSAGKATRCPDCKAKVPIPSSYLARPQIRFYCPRCEGRVRAWAEQSGQSMRCPGCDLRIELPHIEGYVEPEEGFEQSELNPEQENAREEPAEVFEEADDEEEWEEPGEEEEQDEEEEEEPPRVERERSKAAKPILSRRSTRRMVRAALWSLVVVIPIGIFIFLRATRPEWLDRKLINAAEAGTYTRASLLVTCGADVNTHDSAGRTALHAAAEKGNKKIVELLIAGGAAVDREDHAGRTPLLLAVLGGHRDVVEALLDAGADPHVTHPTDGRRLLDIAMANGHNAVADLLLRRREEAKPQAPPPSSIITIPEGAGEQERVALRIPPSRLTLNKEAPTAAPSPAVEQPAPKKRPVIVLDRTRLMPVGYYVRYMLKIGVRRMWGAKGEGNKKFLVVVFTGPIDMFKVSEYEFRYLKEENGKLTTVAMTRHYDPTRFTLILSNGERLRASAIAPNWAPVETTLTSNIFHYDLTKSYESERDLRPGQVAVAWLLRAEECRAPFQVRVDWGQPIAVPDVRYDAEEK